MPQLATDAIAPARDERNYFAHVFGWMALALAVTGGVAAAIGHSQTALHALFESNSSGRVVILACVVIQFLLVGALAGFVEHMTVGEAAATFLAYAAFSGMTLSLIFAAYTTKSIFATFLVTAGMFAALAVAGYTTSLDMTSWGTYLLMALTGELIGVATNILWLNDTLYWATTVTGVLLFSVLTAYDVQKLKRYETEGGGEAVEQSAIVGALALYLDFLNLLLVLLRLLGRRR